MKVLLAGLFTVFMAVVSLLMYAAPFVVAGYILLWILGLV